MSRDQTWHFFTLGRCLERTDVVARQLATLRFGEISDSGLVMLLRSCGGYEPYLRLAHGVVEPDQVLDFLLRDRLFPRSAFASLTVAEGCLENMSPAATAAGTRRGALSGWREPSSSTRSRDAVPGPQGAPGRSAAHDLFGERRGHGALLRARHAY